MRLANILFASMILSAVFGAALARDGRSGYGPQRADTFTSSMTWLWQPPMRRTASIR